MYMYTCIYMYMYMYVVSTMQSAPSYNSSHTHIHLLCSLLPLCLLLCSSQCLSLLAECAALHVVLADAKRIPQLLFLDLRGLGQHVGLAGGGVDRAGLLGESGSQGTHLLGHLLLTVAVYNDRALGGFHCMHG